MYKLLFLAAASVWSWAAPAQSVREVADARILSFEESAAPFTASEGSSLSVSGDHYKHGAHALRWQWSRAGARVRIESPVGYLSENPNPRETSVSTFVFWVYAPKALDGKLRFEFRKEGRTCAWFDYGLEFTGWRGAWVAFDRDMQGRPEEGMDELVVTAEGVERGELYFDHLILSSFQDVRHHTADFQAPFINAATTSHHLTHGFVRGNGYNINREHHITVQLTKLRHHTVLDISGVFPEKNHTPVCVAHTEVVLFKLKGIGADEVLKIVTFPHRL